MKVGPFAASAMPFVLTSEPPAGNLLKAIKS